MKKKTVITTEKHEVWVIRQPEEVSAEATGRHQESADIVELLAALPAAESDEAEPNTKENNWQNHLKGS